MTGTIRSLGDARLSKRLGLEVLGLARDHPFRHRLAALGFVHSMNRPREVTDNAHMESFCHSMKSDAVHGIRFQCQAELERLVRSYMPDYNACGCTPGSAILLPSTMRRRRGNRVGCLQNRGEIPVARDARPGR